MQAKRFFAIDFLRAVGILGVIATHVFSYNLTSPLNTFVWNYLHFVITSFIFCSGYVMFVLYQDKVGSWKALFPWLRKRLSRLFIPYYLYFFVYLGLVFLLPKYFSGLEIQKSWQYIWQSLTFIGGLNENWLPLLFVELALLFPLLLFLLKRMRIVFWIYIGGSLVVTLLFTFHSFPYALYRWVMWIPWSLVFVLSWYFAKREQTKSSTKIYFGISILSAIIFAGLFLWFGALHKSLTLIDNKYPPNLLYISYEFAISFLLLVVTQCKVLQSKWLIAGFTFLSSRSYGLFFVHFLFLDCLLQLNKIYSLQLSVWTEFGVITISSVCVLLLWEKVKKIRSVS